MHAGGAWALWGRSLCEGVRVPSDKGTRCDGGVFDNRIVEKRKSTMIIKVVFKKIFCLSSVFLFFGPFLGPIQK